MLTHHFSKHKHKPPTDTSPVPRWKYHGYTNKQTQPTEDKTLYTNPNKTKTLHPVVPLVPNTVCLIQFIIQNRVCGNHVLLFSSYLMFYKDIQKMQKTLLKRYAIKAPFYTHINSVTLTLLSNLCLIL